MATIGNDTSDAAQWIGADFTLGDTGAVDMAQGALKTAQRIVRRLLTNPGDYIAHPLYGGGLRKKIGSPFSAAEITAIVTAQMFMEPSVARSPAPVITVTELPATGSFTVVIQYVDAPTQLPLVLSFNPANPAGTASVQIQPQGT